LTSKPTYFKTEYLTELNHADEELEIVPHSEPAPTRPANQAALIDKEERETGSVSFAVYRLYGKYAGGWKVLLAGAVCMAMFVIFSALVNIVLAEWTAESPAD
jgi:hypothetical protein